ncbi:MAG: hypothetical protein JKX99_06240 [Robiginitomaculum sp.]|nr:hypothetical protein [Robiginitomaculum sp.]
MTEKQEAENTKQASGDGCGCDAKRSVKVEVKKESSCCMQEERASNCCDDGTEG